MKTLKKAISLFLVLAMISALALPVLADNAEANEKTQFNYVSFGASNTCGYGLTGFIPEEFLSHPELIFDKTNAAGRDGYWTSGYEFYDSRCYPVLVKNALQERLGDGYQVNLKQCALNAFRVDELRYLLDDSYPADSYQMWRMGDGSPNSGWFYDLERERHEPVVIGDEEIYSYTKDATSLREEFITAVKDADYITFDLGVNNFGGFISQRLMTMGTPEEVQVDYSALLGKDTANLFDTARASMKKLISSVSGGAIPTDALGTVDYLIDTLAYALVGFAINFDACMKEIYALNPDVDITAVSIQNLMGTLDGEIAGISIPFGDLFGISIDLANNYMKLLSPYADKYSFADLDAEGNYVSLFLDEIANYNGDPYSLSKDITTAFDLFDEYNQVPVQLGLYYYDTNKLIAGDPATVQLYDKMSHASYHAMAEFFKAAATKCNVVHLDAMDGYTDYNTRSANYTKAWYAFFNNPAMNILSGMPFDEVLEAASADVAKLVNESDSYETFVAMFGRVLFANCFFVHPNAAGHETAKDAILAAYYGDISGKDAFAISLADADKLLAEKLVSYGLDFSTALVQKVVDATGMSKLAKPILDMIASNPDKVVSIITYYTGAYFPNAFDLISKCIQETSKEFAGCGHKDLTFVPAKNASLLFPGHIAYYVCNDCGEYFSDASGLHHINKSSVVVKNSLSSLPFLKNSVFNLLSGLRGLFNF